MIIKRKYSEELKAVIRSEYQEGVNGYKKLARKYGIPRDRIRDIVLSGKQTNKVEYVPKELKFDSIEEELAYYKTAAMYFETYAQCLQENISDTFKKKAGLTQSAGAKEKEQK